MSKNACPFCAIVRDPSLAVLLWEEDDVLAFMDQAPATEGHVLVIPKTHFVGITDMPSKLASQVMRVGQKIARALKKSALRCEGINLLMSEGWAADQDILHAHLHVFCRYLGDGVRIEDEGVRAAVEDLQVTARVIRAEIAA